MDCCWHDNDRNLGEVKNDFLESCYAKGAQILGNVDKKGWLLSALPQSSWQLGCQWQDCASYNPPI